MKFSVYSNHQEIPLSQYDPEAVAIFETMRVYNGRIFREDEHLERLHESAKTINFPQAINYKELKKKLAQALQAYGKKEAAIRLMLIENEAVVMIGERKHSPELYQKGVALRTTVIKRSLTNAESPELKTSAYQNALFASFEPKAKEIYEWVFLDARGYVTEVRIGNLFIVQKDRLSSKPKLKTPPLDGILNGVTRRIVLECASHLGIPVEESPLTRHEIYNAEEVFLTNTTWEILPVRELDGRQTGKKIPGVIAQKLHYIFKKKVAQECQIPT